MLRFSARFAFLSNLFPVVSLPLMEKEAGGSRMQFQDRGRLIG